MFWSIIAILLLLWGISIVNGYTLGGIIHVLPLMAVVVALIRIIQGRRPAEKRGQS